MQRERVVSSFESTAGGDKARTMRWYSGANVYRVDFWSGTEFMLQLSMDSRHVNLNRMKGAPLMKNHAFPRSVDNQVGVIEKAWLSNGEGHAEYRLAETPDVESLTQKIDDKILRNVSMEVVIDEMREVTPKGSKMKHFLAVDWFPEAVALVPVGADPNAQLFSEEDSQLFWLPEGLYTPKFSDAGAASKEVDIEAPKASMLAALLCRR